MVRGYITSAQTPGMQWLDRNIHVMRKDGNRVDPLAVAAVRGDTVLGHLLRKIPSTCSLYLCRDGSIVCRMTGSR